MTLSIIMKGEKTMKNEIILFETADKEVSLQVQMQDETVWLTRSQMAELFDRDVKTIGKHINNAIKEELAEQVVVAKFATTTQHGAIPGKTQTHRERKRKKETQRPI